MKKIFLALAIAAVFFAGCKKDEFADNEQFYGTFWLTKVEQGVPETDDYYYFSSSIDFFEGNLFGMVITEIYGKVGGPQDTDGDGFYDSNSEDEPKLLSGRFKFSDSKQMMTLTPNSSYDEPVIYLDMRSGKLKLTGHNGKDIQYIKQ